MILIILIFERGNIISRTELENEKKQKTKNEKQKKKNKKRKTKNREQVIREWTTM